MKIYVIGKQIVQKFKSTSLMIIFVKTVVLILFKT